MEELSHYKGLRNKYSKELSQTSIEGGIESRPQTAEKHVTFDFSEQMNIQQLRNLRELKEIEFERLSVHSGNDEEMEKKERKEKKKRKKEKKERRERRRLKKERKRKIYFEVLLKPAIEIEWYQAKEPSEASSRRGSYFKQGSKHLSSHHSLYSEGSVCSKKSLVEEIEEAYREAKKSLENSFKVDLDVEARSEKSSVHSSRENLSKRSKEDRYSKHLSHEEHSCHSQEDSKVSNKISKNSESFSNPVNGQGKNEEISRNSSKNQQNLDCNLSLNSNLSRQSHLKENPKVTENSSITEKSLKSKKSFQETLENQPQIKKSSKIPDENLEKFTSYNKNQLFSKILEKPLNQGNQVENFNSDEEEKDSKEPSLKSSVDFTISDQTPFQSVKFSQDPSQDFQNYFTKFKKGVFFRLLSPIIQHLAEDDQKEPQDFSRKNYFEDFSDHSPKGSEKLKKAENFEDFDFRTSRSEPFFQAKTSNLEIQESLNFSISNPKFPESFEFNEISVLEKPQIENFQKFLQEKASIFITSLARLEIRITALNVWNSFFLLKDEYQYKKRKNEKVKLAQATFEFNLLQKVIQEWKNCVKHEKILGSRRFLQFVDRWNFVKLYQSFEGLKFVTRAHKEWISQVRKKRILAKMGRILRNWALFVRFRKVKTRILIKKVKKCLAGWKKVVEMKRVLNRKACVHWYFRKIFKSFMDWNDFIDRRREKWVKRVKADKMFCERIYTKVFLGWKHWKALEQTNFIPLRICTKTVLVKKDGNLREKNLLDIKIIKN
jgi:hypothetical protein